ncbi:hypothetical protein [Phytoactinopolyspora endophytica]|uniref:hypothetical protein n=1 Tax=Phytoactinopolyspora endophytica TaxID=1642495 RepID=UPI00101B5D03|nr:hypothetical protein [Phytoactinopolyspora endophytica]
MNHLMLTKLAWALEHEDGLLDAYRHDPGAVLDRFKLSARHRQAVLDHDAETLLADGLNPVVLRNLLVMLGVPHAELYQRDR